MSNQFKLFIGMTAAPFLVYWSFQAGNVASKLVFQLPLPERYLLPDHPAVFAISMGLGVFCLAKGLMSKVSGRLASNIRSQKVCQGGIK